MYKLDLFLSSTKRQERGLFDLYHSSTNLKEDKKKPEKGGGGVKEIEPETLSFAFSVS